MYASVLAADAYYEAITMQLVKIIASHNPLVAAPSGALIIAVRASELQHGGCFCKMRGCSVVDLTDGCVLCFLVPCLG